MILNLYKQRGETPLERVQRFVEENKEFKGQKMTYMGRLDPMAEGVLLVASGEDVYRKEEFLGLDKEYDFTALFGFATDTYDCLGRVLKVSDTSNLDENEVRRVAMIYEGERDQEYPPYSSKMISSRGSFSLSENPSLLEGGRGEAPSKKITIHKLQFHKLESLSTKELFGRLLMDISKVKGDFRQNQTLILWKKILFGSNLPSPSQGERSGVRSLGLFSAHVSSGTYIRGIVNDIGKTLGVGACALSITRTRVGDFKIKDSVK